MTKPPKRKPKTSPAKFARSFAKDGRIVRASTMRQSGLRAKKPATKPSDNPYDPDNMPITPEDIESGKLVMVRKRGRPVGSRKTQKTVRLDDDVIKALQADGTGWQTRMNAILREALQLDESDAKAS